MAIFTYDINKFKFSVADMEQVRKDFSRGRQHIFINGILLEEICEKRKITLDQENYIQEADFLKLLKQGCFIGDTEEQLLHWQKFVNALCHQGGLLYAFESSLKEKMSLPENNSKAYIPGKTEKEVHISFEKRGLTIQENCIFTKLKDSGDEKNNLVAKNGNYLLKAQLSHYVSLFEEDGELKFRHVIAQPEFECKNSDLQKCLNQRRLSIMEILKNFISKIFRLKFEPNRTSFFQKSYYQSKIGLSQITMKEGDNNMLENSYTKITNHG
jgi:hypothetical protein